jgi:hypothetical protein
MNRIVFFMKLVTTIRRPVALTLILGGVLVAMSSAAAQSRTSADIQAQFLKSAELQRQALRSLNDERQAEQLITKAYAELQAGLSIMIINASGAKFPDPLLGVQTQRANQALSFLQRAVDTLRQNPPDRPVTEDQERTGQPAESRAYLDEVRKNLEQALRLTNILTL